MFKVKQHHYCSRPCYALEQFTIHAGTFSTDFFLPETKEISWRFAWDITHATSPAFNRLEKKNIVWL